MEFRPGYKLCWLLDCGNARLGTSSTTTRSRLRRHTHLAYHGSFDRASVHAVYLGERALSWVVLLYDTVYVCQVSPVEDVGSLLAQQSVHVSINLKQTHARRNLDADRDNRHTSTTN